MVKEIQNRWAFLVGVNRYRESRRFRRLNHCVHDVLALQQLLKAVGYGVICLHDDLKKKHPDDPEDQLFPDKAETVLAAFRSFCRNIGPDDLLLVYFACHGTRELQPENTKPYLIFRETFSENPETALAIADFKDEMTQHCQAERQVVLLDACHMGAGTDERGDDSEAERQFIRNVYELATGFALLSASTAQQKAKESDAIQHGVFSKFVLSGLAGDALVSKTETGKKFVSVGSLGQYVYNRTLIWSANEGDGPQAQKPQWQAEGDLAEMILVDYRGQSFPALPETETSFPPTRGEHESRARSSDDQEVAMAFASGWPALPLASRMKLEDRKRELTKLTQEVETLNRQIDECVDYKLEEKYKTRKDNIFNKIGEISQEIQQLEKGNG